IESPAQRRGLVINSDGLTAHGFLHRQRCVSFLRNCEIDRADIATGLPMVEAGGHNDFPRKLVFDLKRHFVRIRTLELRVVSVAAAEIETGARAQFVQLRKQVAVAIGPRALLRRLIDGIDPELMVGTDADMVSAGAQLERRSAVAENVVYDANPR